MPNNKTHKDHVLKRRELVGKLRARQLTHRQIVVALAEEEKFLNPKTGKPYSILTVNHDIRWCEAQWREHCIKSIEEHKARVLNEIGELKRQGWAEKDLAIVVKALAKECDVIGLNAPTRLAGADGGPLMPQRVELVFVDAEKDADAGSID